MLSGYLVLPSTGLELFLGTEKPWAAPSASCWTPKTSTCTFIRREEFIEEHELFLEPWREGARWEGRTESDCDCTIPPLGVPTDGGGAGSYSVWLGVLGLYAPLA